MVRKLFVLLVPLVLVAGACSKDDDKKDASGRTTTTTTTEAPTSTTGAPPEAGSSTTTSLPSTTTVPGDGIPMTGSTGSGTVKWSASSEQSEFCYSITVRGIGTPSEAHVHQTDGVVRLVLQAPPADGAVNTCTATDSLFVEEVKSQPGNFFIDVHGPKGVLKATLR
jgi:hypothetical protein